VSATPGRQRATPTVSAAQERLLHCQQHQGQQKATPTESAAQLKAWGEATRWLKGRAENEQVAKLTARGRLLRAQFWVPVRIFQTSPGFFSHCKVELDFFRMKGPKSSHFSVLNFVTSGGVFSVLKPVEMCDQFLAWRAQCTSPPERSPRGRGLRAAVGPVQKHILPLEEWPCNARWRQAADHVSYTMRTQ